MPDIGETNWEFIAMPSITQKITPCLWFNFNAEEAVNFYVSVFKNSRILSMSHYGPNMPGPEGAVLTIEFELDGQRFTALNGGSAFQFNEAISLMVACDTQAEIDEFWKKLTANGGKEIECSWLKDKYGMAWQIVPAILPELISSGDQARTNRVMAAVMKMKKLDIETLKRAADGKQGKAA
jgi:predicted 3-demethylubiquinone-9 3-methyltransferase (glyoxalase superfamily)